MKQTPLVSTAIAAVLLLSGCASMGNKTAPPDKDVPADAVATVNGKAISKNALNSLIAEITKQNPEQTVPEDKAVESLINRELLRQEAERQDLQKSPNVIGRLENLTRDALAQAAVENIRKAISITDDDIRKEYDAKVGGADLTEFKARHILLETEQQAKEVQEKLKKGAKFAELAKKVSKDPSAKQNGGDLGWFNPQQMVPEFSATVAALKNGETTTTPIKTEFGWHVIQREDSRKSEPPPFDAVKEQIRNMLTGQKIQQHVEALKNAAKIDNKVSDKK